MWHDVIFRWSFGDQNTVTFSELNDQQHCDRIKLLKLSIMSFQKWFSRSRFIVFYNGSNLQQFNIDFHACDIELYKPVEVVHQLDIIKNNNPYHFMPQGVFWKWIPFRYDMRYDEISVDTDIICINDPVEWKQWLDNRSSPILLAPDRFSQTNESTCGKFATHPLLRNKKPVNCGVVGQKREHDYSDTFFEITRYIDFGQEHNSLFIDEQGAINVWAYLLEVQGIAHCCLSFEKCAWFRDFIFYLMSGIAVETVHATSWHKEILIKLISFFTQKILQDDYSNYTFVSNISKFAPQLDSESRYVLEKQIVGKI